MKVEIWSDIACPFCYIGKRKFEAALKQFDQADEVEIVYRSFELDPNAPTDIEEDVYDMLAGKYGMSRERAIAMNQQVADQAKAVGLDFQFDELQLTNTFDAHRLIHHAKEQGKQAEMAERLFQAYFTDSAHVGKPDTLTKLAEEVGLDLEQAASVISSRSYADDVRQDEQEAARIGVRGVPFFLFNRKYAVSGAQPVDTFIQALNKLKEANS